MAINIMKNANQSTVGGQHMTFRYLFDCCYGGHKSPRAVLSYASINGVEKEKISQNNDENEDCEQDDHESKDIHSESRRLWKENTGDAHKLSSSAVNDDTESISPFRPQDVDDNCSEKLNITSLCGIIDVVLQYEQKKECLFLMVKQAREINIISHGGFQIRVVLLPNKKIRHSTKIRDGISPEFKESFVFTNLSTDDINEQALRFRLYGCERMRRNKLLGGIVLLLKSVDLSTECNINLILEPSHLPQHLEKKKDSVLSEMSSLAGSNNSVTTSQGPELLLGLAYNGTTGRLACEIIKGSFIKCVGMTRAPDSYVKLALLSASGQEISRSKTTVRRSNPNPLFRETFMFQIPMLQLADVTLVITVLAKKVMNRKESIGSFTLGLTNSGDDEYAHWSEMKEARGEQVCRWHNLLENPL